MSNQMHLTRAIDQIGRVVLPIELRKKMGVTEGKSLFASAADGAIVLHHENGKGVECAINQLGLVSLPKELREAAGIHTESNVNVYYTDDTILLKAAN